jgi:uncharacterized membrane protein
MKKKLILLCISFLVLSGVCLYYPNRSTGMLVALIVELVFFIHYVILRPANDAKMTKQDTGTVNELEEINPQLQQKQTTVKSAEIEEL